MAEDEKEPLPLPAYGFNPDDIVVLLVGSQERKMIVHSPQITAHSEFFAASLKKEWIEGQARDIKLPEEEPEIMAYDIEFVYFSKLPTDIYTTTSPGLEKEFGYKLLAELYVLAERMLDSKCRNRVLQEILRLRDLKCKTNVKWNPTCVPINIIYQGTTPGSPARRLLVDIHVSDAREDWYPEDVHVDPVFLMDLVRRFLGCFKTSEGLPKNNRFDIAAEDYTI